MDLPTKNSLSINYKQLSTQYRCTVYLDGKFLISSDAHSYSEYANGSCLLVYEMDLRKDDIALSVLNQKSSILWYDCSKEDIESDYIAYIYLIEIKPQFRRDGLGTEYVEIQHKLFKQHNIERVHIDAAHDGMRFWLRMGYTFVRESDFWSDFEEYCTYSDDGYKYRDVTSFDNIPEEFFDYLTDAQLKYQMYKIL